MRSKIPVMLAALLLATSIRAPKVNAGTDAAYWCVEMDERSCDDRKCIQRCINHV